MNRLVIHPKDRSTDFLSRVYRDLPDVTLVTDSVSKHDLRDMVFEADQVLMMGHGTPFGLLSGGNFPNAYGNIVDASFVPALSEKDNSVFIWCNADQFVERFKLKGFYTGMFVSEVTEADYMGITPMVSYADVENSNAAFVGTVGRFIEREPRLIHAAAKHEYGQLAASNLVAHYNSQRLYVQ